MDVRDVHFLVIIHAHQRGREPGDLGLFGDHQRDRLAAEPDPVVIERPEWRTLRGRLVLVGVVRARHARPVLVREHINHACDGERIAWINARDTALGDGGGNNAGMRKAGCIELAGIFRDAGDLGVAVDAGYSAADIRRHGAHRILLSDCDWGVPVAAWVSARTIARRARSILKALCSKPLASRSTKSAARENVASMAGCPRSAASAAKSRHGLCATPPSARRASPILFPSSSSAAATDTSAKA